MNRILACVTGICVFGTLSTAAWEHPNIFLNQDEISAIKTKIQANQQPWKSGYDKMMADANAALNQKPLSVTFQGDTGHDYFTMPAYDWSNNMENSPCGESYCDGQINPKADRKDYDAAKKLGKAVRSLGLAWVFTGNNT